MCLLSCIVQKQETAHSQRRRKTVIRRIVTILSLYSALTIGATAQQSAGEIEKALQQKSNDVGTLVNLGKLCHEQGSTGDEQAVEKGIMVLDKALEIEKTNSMALVYRGSLWTMRGRDASDPFEKMKDVENGIDDMNKAVELAPDDISVRLVRGINSIQLPTFFNRLSTAIKDFSFLVEDPRLSHLDVQLQATIYCWAGVAYKRDSQRIKAKELLEKAFSLSPNSGIAQKAEQELADLH